jgi:hypothetical protein
MPHLHVYPFIQRGHSCCTTTWGPVTESHRSTSTDVLRLIVLGLRVPLQLTDSASTGVAYLAGPLLAGHILTSAVLTSLRKGNRRWCRTPPQYISLFGSLRELFAVPSRVTATTRSDSPSGYHPLSKSSRGTYSCSALILLSSLSLWMCGNLEI